MKAILRRRPSPALVIACIALFVSLGGVSYGLATGYIDSREIKNNSVRSKDIRNNTLRTFDIRNNEVRGFDIRNSSIQGRDVAFNTLTGADISEPNLAKVPSASQADTAASASSVSVLRTIAPTSLAEGAAPVALLTHGPLTLSFACEASGGGTEARLRVQTTEPTTAAGASTSSPDATAANSPVMGPGDGPVQVAAVADSAGATRSIGAATAFASAPSVKSISGLLVMHADADSGAGACLVHGAVTLEG